MALLQSEFLTVNIAPETTFGTQAAAAWWQAEPDVGGITDFYAQLKNVAREPVSKNMMEEIGEVVGLDAAPKLMGDLNVDMINMLGASILRTTAKFPGGTGTGRWTGAAGYGARVSAVTAGAPASYTVDVGGALPSGTIVFGEGFLNDANNGIHVLTSGSIATSIKTSDTLVTEVPPANARLWVVGYQAAVTDFAITVAGGVTSLTSIANVLNTLGITPDSWMWIGGGTAAAPGALGFTINPANRGLVHVLTVAAGAITIDRFAAAFGADAGTGKTIQIFFGPWFRNVPNDSADYAKLSHTLELVLPKLAAGSADDFCYSIGSAIGTFDLDAGLEGLVKATIGFVAMDCTDPTITRATGAAAALAPTSPYAFQTADGVKRGRVTKLDGTPVLSGDIQSWKLAVNHGAKPYKAQGGTAQNTPGNRDILFGKVTATATLNASVSQDDLWKAIRANTKLRWEELLRSSTGAGFLVDFPYCTASGGAPSGPANDVVQFSPVLRAFKDPVSGKALAMQLFPYLPAS
jgi:hypothetical protein